MIRSNSLAELSPNKNLSQLLISIRVPYFFGYFSFKNNPNITARDTDFKYFFEFTGDFLQLNE